MRWTNDADEFVRIRSVTRLAEILSIPDTGFALESPTP
jgi:hypothetical protein